VAVGLPEGPVDGPVDGVGEDVGVADGPGVTSGALGPTDGAAVGGTVGTGPRPPDDEQAAVNRSKPTRATTGATGRDRCERIIGGSPS
jgi:hypothetical protein